MAFRIREPSEPRPWRPPPRPVVPDSTSGVLRLDPGPAQHDPDEDARFAQRHAEDAARDAYDRALYRGEWVSGDGRFRTDFHPSDTPPGRYAAPPLARPGGDVRDHLADSHDAWHSGSPHEIRVATCVDCGALGTLYGRVDLMPEQPRCGPCAAAADPAPDPGSARAGQPVASRRAAVGDRSAMERNRQGGAGRKGSPATLPAGTGSGASSMPSGRRGRREG